jgi:hypothetical protein
VPESYIPWNNSQRSRNILAVTNKAMGDPLRVNGSPAAESRTVEQHFHITINGYQASPDEIIAKTRDKLAWELARG